MRSCIKGPTCHPRLWRSAAFSAFLMPELTFQYQILYVTLGHHENLVHPVQNISQKREKFYSRPLLGRRSGSAVCRLPSAVCCPLSAVCCPLSVVRGPMSAVRHPLFASCPQAASISFPLERRTVTITPLSVR